MSLTIYNNGCTDLLRLGATRANHELMAGCQKYREYVTRKNFCAGFFSKGGGACNRDVGSPGVVDGILMGIVSFGSPVCGTPDAPTVFTKIGYYTDWIEDIMEQDVPVIRKKTTLQHNIKLTTSYNYTPKKPTTFKIPPLHGKMKPIPIKEVDNFLRNAKLFEEFLSTIFGSKEDTEYLDLLRESHKFVVKKEEKQTTLMQQPKKNIEIEKTTPSYYIDARTSIGNFDPISEEEFKPVTAIFDSSKKDTLIKTDKDIELEKDLVNLIDNIDLKQIIDNISSLEDDKIMDDSKIIDFLKDKDQNLNEDESILTLLYLSDSEKNKGSKVGKLDLLGDDDFIKDEVGLSIATDSFKDMTYRNKNISVLNDLLPKEELYDLLSEAIQNN